MDIVRTKCHTPALMTDIQPLGYTPESVEASCRHLTVEAYQCLERVEESLALVRTRFARMYPKLPDEISAWRSRLEAAAFPPDQTDLLEYRRISDGYAASDAESEPELSAERQLDIALGSVPVFSRMIPGRIATVEYIRDHPPSFHFDVLQRMHELLVSKHPIVLQGSSNLPKEIAADLCAADPVLPAWHAHMGLMLHERAFMNGVSWPPNVGNALARHEWSEVRED